MALAAPPDQTPGPTADSQHPGLLGLLPAAARPFASMARFDRPIGWWLLVWPCAWGLALAGARDWRLYALMLAGAVAMRGAGCVYNDIVDRDLDARVARTAARPLARGTVSPRAAWVWLGALSLVGLAVLVQLRWEAEVVALASLVLVAVYPWMKRITWWPQVWLGLVFAWGALVGGAAVTGWPGAAVVTLYAGAVCWVVGYDTIYALADRADDALIGVRSSARRLGSAVRSGVAGFYLVALALWAAALWQVRGQGLALVGLLPAALHLGWQVATLRVDDAADPLTKFRSNRTAGLLVFAACLVVGWTS